MALNETARERLADVRELEPTSNGELADRWGMDSGKEVAAYLREELSDHTYRDDESRIRAVESVTDGGTGVVESPASIDSPSEAPQHTVIETEASNEGDGLGEDTPTPQNPAEHTDTVDMTQEELDQVIDAAAETGYKDGYRDGQAAASDEMSGEEIEGLWRDAYNEGYGDGYEEAQQSVDNGSNPEIPETVDIPCGHESIEVAKFLREHKVTLGCEVCGEWWEGTLLD